MTASLNNVQLIGNVGRKPEIRTFPDGNRQAIINIATTDVWRDKGSGERNERTEWHRVVFTGAVVNVIEKYVGTGTQVFVQAELRSRKYREEGAAKDTYVLEIRGRELQMLGRSPKASNDPAPGAEPDEDVAPDAKPGRAGSGRRAKGPADPPVMEGRGPTRALSPQPDPYEWDFPMSTGRHALGTLAMISSQVSGLAAWPEHLTPSNLAVLLESARVDLEFALGLDTEPRCTTPPP